MDDDFATLDFWARPPADRLRAFARLRKLLQEVPSV